MMTRSQLRFVPALRLLAPFALIPVVGCSGESEDDDASAASYDTPDVDPSEAGNAFVADGTWASMQVMSQYVENALPTGPDYELQTVTSYKLVTLKTETDGSVTYAEDLCVTDLSEVSGSQTTLNQGFYDASGPIPYKATVDAQIGGTFTLPTQIELKGVNLASITDPLPTADDYDDGKADVYDYDGDGDDGFTITVEGAIDGTIWAVERYTFAFDGTVVDADTITGLISGEIEDAIIYTSSFLIPDDTDVYPDDVPEHNFFEMKRQADDYTCAKLVADRDTLF